MISKRFILTTALTMASAPAWAHTGAGVTSDFVSGFVHPFHGMDHVLAMVTVGLFAATIGGRALWAVPASFVVMMLAGAALGGVRLGIPAGEAGILASVIVLGSAVAVGRSWPSMAAMGLTGTFAVFHGYAHGTEMPFGAGVASYSLGFALATTLLHGSGLLAGTACLSSRRVTRFAGAAVAVAGVALAMSR
jgi:urease accessory protein